MTQVRTVDANRHEGQVASAPTEAAAADNLGRPPALEISRRRFLIGSGLAVGSAALVACTGSTASPSVSPSSASTIAPASSSPGGVTGDIVLWYPYGQEERQQALQRAFDAFQSENPGARVLAEVVPFGDFASRWPAAQQAGTLPDLAINVSENLLPPQVAGAIDGDTLNGLFESLGGDPFFAPGYLDKTGRYKGQLFALPHYAHNRLLLYRKDRLQAAGLGVPETLDDVERAAAAMTKAPDYFGWVMQLAQEGGGGGELLWMITRANGGSLIDADGQSLWRSDEVRFAADYLGRIARQYGPEAAATTAIGDLFNRFADGTSSIVVDSAANLGVANRNADIKPEVLAALDGTHMPTGSAGPGDMIGAISMTTMKGRNPDGAAELARVLYRPEFHLDFLQSIPLFMFPATTNIDLGAFLDNPVLSRYETVVEETVRGIEEGSPAGFEHGPNPFIGPVLASRVAENMIQGIAFGGVSVSDAINAAADEVDAILEDVRSRTGG